MVCQGKHCEDNINYGSRVYVALVEPASKGKKHTRKVALQRFNFFCLNSNYSASVKYSDIQTILNGLIVTERYGLLSFNLGLPFMPEFVDTIINRVNNSKVFIGQSMEES